MKEVGHVLIWMVFFISALDSQSVNPDLGNKAYDLLNIPSLVGEKVSGQVIIAVIDDGFLLSHNALKNFYLLNPHEIPGNGVDDDSNGYIDDVCGWDAADMDGDVTVADNLKMDNYHGTMVSSIISNIAMRGLGEHASDIIKIMPIKALSDHASNSSMEKGYRGIEYAINNGADIICMAWSGGKFDDQYASLFRQASKKGILMIAAAGNMSKEPVDPPSSLPGVFCVAAIDSLLRKSPKSNYGTKVDIVASGDRVMAAHSSADNAYFSGQGSSSAVSLVAGGSALLKLMQPDARPIEIMAAIKNTSMPIEAINSVYNGRLGAGAADFTKALDYLLNKADRNKYFLSSRPEGDIVISKNVGQKQWEIQSSTGTENTHFILTSDRNASKKGEMRFYTADSLYYHTPLRAMPLELVVPGNYAKLEFAGKMSKTPITFNYFVVPIDSTSMYCDRETILNTPFGDFSDGSGEEKYANRVSCKWIINAPEGKNIRLDFDQLDTQTNIDMVMIFHGNSTLQENLIAKFSGNSLPPIIVSAMNQVLIWFVTNQSETGQGWHLNYSTVDDKPGVIPREN